MLSDDGRVPTEPDKKTDHEHAWDDAGRCRCGAVKVITQREMTEEEKEWLVKAQADTARKISEGILPTGAEPAICLTVGCTHWAHNLEKNWLGGKPVGA